MMSGCLFQFHKGTIRTQVHQNTVNVKLHFNSIKVQLEPQLLQAAFLLVLFQFHKGTIRTASPSKHRQCKVAFQFHKGTIRTEVPRPWLSAPCYFNSIKVQLELNFHRLLV